MGMVKMISINVVYSYDPNKKFDWDYYLKTHVGMIKSGLGEKLKGITIEKGLSGIDPSSPPVHECFLRILLDSLDDMPAVMAILPELAQDIPNYTDTTTYLQISQIVDL
jgi:uncharacterized protein (TIGR02118 family)